MKQRSTLAVTMVLLMSLLTLTGCSNVKSKKDALLDPLTPTAYPQIAALDGIGRWLSFMTPATSPQNDGRMKIIIPVAAVDGPQREVEYKFEFFDNRGRPLSKQEDWKFMRLPPRTTRHLETISPDHNTRNWRLVIRPAGAQS